MSDGLAAIQSRIAELRSLVTPTAPVNVRPAGSTQFASALSQAMGAGATAATGAAAGAGKGEQAVEIARTYLGVPYVWGGTDPKRGLDCSGLTQLVMKQVGVEIPRTSREQARAGTEVSSLKNARPGDLVFFGSPVDHVGIYAGNGKMIDAPHSGEKVKLRDVWETPSHIRRVLPQGSALPAGATPASAATAARAGAVRGASSLDTPYAELFTQAGRKHGVDPALLAAIAKAESNFDPNARSGAGAIGLMQIMPGTARDLGVDPRNPAQAVDGAARLISRHLKSYDGRVDLALAAYNAGPGNVRKYHGVPPFDETRTYIQRVTANWKDLR